MVRVDVGDGLIVQGRKIGRMVRPYVADAKAEVLAMTSVSSRLADNAVGPAAVPDPVFSGAMVGPGTAVDPIREAAEAVALWTE